MTDAQWADLLSRCSARTRAIFNLSRRGRSRSPQSVTPICDSRIGEMLTGLGSLGLGLGQAPVFGRQQSVEFRAMLEQQRLALMREQQRYEADRQRILGDLS